MSQSYPSPQNAADIFKGSWFSHLPDVDGVSLTSGKIGLFDDERIRWAKEQAGGFEGKRILELGPLEGGHSYLLSRMGADHVLAIEANTRLYLKCLIAKELYKLDKCNFLLGDFIKYMKETSLKFDFCLASGVLYHMENPAELLSLVARVSDRAMIWTQYYDHEVIQRRMSLFKRLRFRPGEQANYDGFTYTRHERRYGVRLRSLQFIGGTAVYSCWMTLDDIIAGLKHFGFKKVEIGFHDKEHVNGPAVCLACAKYDL
jgi:Protein of unknown function (DUF1698)